MKYLILLLALCLSGCSVEASIDSASNSKPPEKRYSLNGFSKICFEGVTYIVFRTGSHKSDWGGVQFDKEGKVVTCEN